MTLDDLRKIAEAATPGPWEAVTDGKPDFYGLLEWRIGNPAYPPVTRAGMTRESAEFIATFNPQKVLEMIDWQASAVQAMDWAQGKIDRLEARLAAVEKLHAPGKIVDVWGKSLTMPDDFQVCRECTDPDNNWVAWPCDTIKAVRGE